MSLNPCHPQPGAARRTSRILIIGSGLAWIVACVSPVMGQNAPGQMESAADWGGLRDRLEQRGIQLDAGFTLDSSRPVSGGIRKRRTDRGLLDAAVELDLEQLAALPGSTFFSQLQNQAGRNGSNDVGDLQGYSNIDARNFLVLYEMWYQGNWFDGQLRLKAGKVDANTEFAVTEAGLDFVHSSPGFSPTVTALPTFPDPTLSANLFIAPREGLTLGFGMYNARDGGAVSARSGLNAEFKETFWVTELTLNRSEDSPYGAGRIAVGAWRHSGDFVRFDGSMERGLSGWYGVAEQQLWSDPGDDDACASLTAFVQYGLADQDVAEFAQHVAAGLLFSGWWPQRPHDRSGLMLSHVDLSDDAAAGFPRDEAAVELFHLFQVNRCIGVQPDLQFIAHPSGQRGLRDTLVATLRLSIRF